MERQAELGGQVARLHRTFPTLEPAPGLAEKLRQRVIAQPRLNVLTGAQVTALDGYVGNFRAQVRRGAAQLEVRAGAIVVATCFEA